MIRRAHLTLAIGMLCGARSAHAQQVAFIAPTLPTASAHASTIVETREGVVAAWFGGTREGAPDVGVWLSRQEQSTWSAPVEIANGLGADGRRFACNNPVLFVLADGTLQLYYKVGSQPALWWGMMKSSRDNGRTWSEAARLPDGILGPIKNKPIQLANGVIVSGSSTESVDATPIWRVHFELSRDGGTTWTKVVPRPAEGRAEIDAIQPSILQYADGRLQAIGRTRSERVFETWSADSGKTWSALSLLTLRNPNAGIDAVTLRDGRQLIVFNDTTRGRTPLSVSTSRDGKTWTPLVTLETSAGEYSYPAVIQSRDGRVHITYTWNRTNIKYVVIDP